MAKKNEEEKKEEVKYEIYIKERESLVSARLQVATSLDKYVLTLSGAALGLSITFISNIVGESGPKSLELLKYGWLCFIISILSTLISLLASQKAYDKQIEILEKVYIEVFCYEPKNRYSITTTLLNIFSVVSFVVGAIFLALFAIKNI